MRFISIKLHIVADYLSGLFLLACPWLLNLDTGSDAGTFASTAGITVLIMSMITCYKGGLIYAIPFNWHLGLDVLFGIVMVIAAFLFTGPAKWAFAGMALLALLFGLCTRVPLSRRTC